jgi:hypothetical protein
MNMVGTMKMVSIFCTSISRRNSSGSNRGVVPPSLTADDAEEKWLC